MYIYLSFLVVLKECVLLQALELAPLRPLGRIPHLKDHGIKLLYCLRLRRIIHPRLTLQTLFELLADLLQHPQRGLYGNEGASVFVLLYQ